MTMQLFEAAELDRDASLRKYENWQQLLLAEESLRNLI